MAVIEEGEDAHVILLGSGVIVTAASSTSAAPASSATLLVPNFVLGNCSASPTAPTACVAIAAAGLDILGMLQNESPVPVRITDMDAPRRATPTASSWSLARRLGCPIMTNDYNLNKVAELQGITVLNINDLANAVRLRSCRAKNCG